MEPITWINNCLNFDLAYSPSPNLTLGISQAGARRLCHAPWESILAECMVSIDKISSSEQRVTCVWVKMPKIVLFIHIQQHLLLFYNIREVLLNEGLMHSKGQRSERNDDFTSWQPFSPVWCVLQFIIQNSVWLCMLVCIWGMKAK